MIRNKIEQFMGDKSIKSLGEEIGMTYSAIHRIVKSEDLSSTTLGNVVLIAKTLGVGLEELYDEILYKVTKEEKLSEEKTVLVETTTYNTYDECISYIHSNLDIQKYIDYSYKREEFKVIYTISSYNGGTGEVVNENEIVFDITEIAKLRERCDDCKALRDIAESSIQYAEDILNKNEGVVEVDFLNEDIEQYSRDIGIEARSIEAMETVEEIVGEMNRLVELSIKREKFFREELVKITEI